MKNILLIIFVLSGICSLHAQTLINCKVDTTGGYISVFDTVKYNPICNYEVLTKAHLDNHSANNRDTISFFPHKIDVLYKKSGYSRGHCLPFEDLAYSYVSAKASMNEKRNLAPQPQNENIGTKLACEDTCRLLANQQGSIQVFGGTWGTYGSMKGINIPEAYWTMIIDSDNNAICWWLPTHGGKIGYHDLGACRITQESLEAKLGFEPPLVIFKQQIR
ncbi:DNA/RNA non-specific endonuclease [Mucilaginibacter xinganensis]|uniref:Uncharacterized protein n=1 Tax=Mucilaginibacter xinganensis TaxID=1234841 RepID=A0A223NX41_9SPHI|nr:DNA/RNA non-specific endonuclease [Mucilaginibacter xinganensis]ASU34432.1 hypothetical protein MuYL_2545 [Mucilaginibacter xinganensis]